MPTETAYSYEKGFVTKQQLYSALKKSSTFLGVWNALTNTPEIVDGVGTNGNQYRVSVSGTQDLGSGSISFSAGNLVIYDGTLGIWQQAGGAGSGVASITGNIVDNTDPLNPIVTQAQSDWNEADSGAVSFINNKPDLAVIPIDGGVF